jgi:hypothetical protein
MYIRLNRPAWSRESQRAYLHDARIGLGDQYPGANWVAHVRIVRNDSTDLLWKGASLKKVREAKTDAP